jgi:threonine aldolase
VDAIDLRSDTVTQPTPEMRRAMTTAPLGDDVMGDDPTVNRLEEVAAARLGKEASVFLPTGTMGNLIGVAISARTGEEIIADAESHVYLYEAAGAAAVAGVQIQPVATAAGVMSSAQIEAAVRPRDDSHFALTAALFLENTHNRHGGVVWPLDALRAAAATAHEQGIKVHLDGARIFNASVKLGMPVKDLCAGFDTVSVCLSKGLGTPAGTVLVGRRELVDRARRIRKMLGGTMRQVGILAAAGIHALEHNVERLAEDHANAERLAKGLAALGLKVDPVHTNMVFVAIPKESVAGLKEHLEKNGAVALVSPKLRLVTHLDVDAAAIDRAVAIFGAFFASAAASGPRRAQSVS